MAYRQCVHHGRPYFVLPRRIRVLILALLVLLPCSASSAQYYYPWTPNIEPKLKSRYDERLVDRIIDWFDLSDDQTVVVRSLHSSHLEAMQEFAALHRPTIDRYDKQLKALPVTSVESMRLHLEREEKLAPVVEQQFDLDAQFLDDLRTILTNEQRNRWEDFQYWLYREWWAAKRAVFREEHLDLTALTEESLEAHELKYEEVIPADLRRRYNRELGAALAKSVKPEIDFCRRYMRRMKDRFETDGDIYWIGSDPNDPDQSKMHRARKDQLHLHRVVRDVNRRYQQAFEAALPEAVRPTWTDLLLRELRPWDRDAEFAADNYRRLIRQLIEHEALVTSISPEQRAIIDSVIISNRAELLTLTDRYVEAYDRANEADYDHSLRNERPDREAAQTRAEQAVGERYQRSIDTIRKILTPAQRTMLKPPAKPDEDS